MNKKRIFYLMNVETFYDSNKDGIGDIKGIEKKLGYFKYLGVDTLVIQKVMSNELFSLRKSIGTNEELKLLTTKAKQMGIDILIEFDYLKLNQTIEKYLKNTTGEMILSAKFKKIIETLSSLVTKYSSLGVAGFEFIRFSSLMNDKDKMLKSISFIYKKIKEISPKFIIKGSSSFFDFEDTDKITYGENKAFDYFTNKRLSFVGASKEENYWVKKQRKTTLLLGRMINKFYRRKDNSQVISFGSRFIGRFIERWGNDSKYHEQSAKAIFIMKVMITTSISIYAGDEFGVLNKEFTSLNDFNDVEIDIKRQRYLSNNKKRKNSNFFIEQSILNKEASETLIPWNSNFKTNYGFSKGETNFSAPKKSILFNIKNQVLNNNSAINFAKKLINFTNSKEYLKFYNDAEFSVGGTILNVLTYKIMGTNNKNIIVVINLSDEPRRIKKYKKYKILFSSYNDITKKPHVLRSYEALILTSIEELEELKKEDIFKKENTQLKEAVIELNKSSQEKLNEIKQQVNINESYKTNEINVFEEESIEGDDSIDKLEEDLIEISTKEINIDFGDVIDETTLNTIAISLDENIKYANRDYSQGSTRSEEEIAATIEMSEEEIRKALED
ncbi:MAG: hypothetical protein K4H23_04955 [Mollicutes bacterium PWAP]|nr:hypothetical protein [Mollicutes bacterium PWAP]